MKKSTTTTINVQGHSAYTGKTSNIIVSEVIRNDTNTQAKASEKQK